MKTITSFILTLFCCFSCSLFAQDIKWGTKQDDSKYKEADVEGYNSSGLFIRRYNSKEREDGYQIEKIGPDGNSVFIKGQFAEGNNGSDKPSTIEKILIMRDNMILLEHGDVTYYAYKMNFNCVLDQKNVTVGDVDFKIKYSDKLMHSNYYRFRISSDSTKFLAYYYPYKSNRVTMRIFDENLTELNDKTVEFPFEGKELEDAQCYFNGDRAIFSINLKEVKKGEPDFFLFMYDFKSGTLKQLALDVVAKGSSEGAGFVLKKMMNHSGDFIVSTLYSTSDSKYPVGLYYARVNHNSNDFTVNATIPLPKEVIAQFIGEREASSGKGINGLLLKSIYDCPGGSVVFGAEFHNPGTVDYYGACLVGKITPDGQMAWAKKIAKKQTVNYPSPAYSYLCAVSSDKVYVFFNDRKENLEFDREKANEDEGMLKAAYCSQDRDACYVVMEELSLTDGTMKQSCIQKPAPGNEYLTFMPMSNFNGQLDVSTLLLYRNLKSSYQFGVLKLD